ncbi:CBS domain-containing protein [Desulfobacula sp.]|uniref:CBS domain-containing protein n=1 Tax=Desulfobacula sp. TaxID=2593537 RepID=UPI0039B82A3E
MIDTENNSSGTVHRDLIVMDESGVFKGKITMTDLFRALEPNYKQLDTLSSNDTLTKEYLLDAVKTYDLWLAPVSDLCERGSGVMVSEVMHTPFKDEYVHENDSLEIALHKYVMGSHQPLIVRDDEQVTGILRFEKLFEVIKDHMLTCRLRATG